MGPGHYIAVVGTTGNSGKKSPQEGWDLINMGLLIMAHDRMVWLNHKLDDQSRVLKGSFLKRTVKLCVSKEIPPKPSSLILGSVLQYEFMSA